MKIRTANFISEDYVSFEVAKLLKEKGFKWACQAFYTNDELCSSDIACPTLYMAQKWLREEKGTHIIVTPQLNRENISVHYTSRIITIFDYSTEKGLDRNEHKCRFYDAYEECLNAAILGALKLI